MRGLSRLGGLFAGPAHTANSLFDRPPLPRNIRENEEDVLARVMRESELEYLRQ